MRRFSPDEMRSDPPSPDHVRVSITGPSGRVNFSDIPKRLFLPRYESQLHVLVDVMIKDSFHDPDYTWLM
ncbi:MAG TPA: hypothetical protein VFL72_01635 [Acidimicrobiia bacterium]|nr:hypothetical protein [Acidimicrobiia bacterium]